ncbi:MAG: acyl-CoA desaturase [Ferruginibacter sp.]|nr:acyl-CoA desaturase [Ferruginibacter sp.]
MSKVIFSNKDNAFFQSLKTSVDEYFEKKKIAKTGDWRLFSKTFILVGGAIAIYLSLILLNLSTGFAILLCILLGFFMAFIGFSVMHDANHGSYSANHKLNDFVGLTLNLLGASSFFWKQKHNILHHTYPNVDGLDDDIAKSPIIRQCESQKWVPAHKVQHIYLTFIYALSPIFWVFIMDPTKYFTHKINGTTLWKMSLKNHIIFWVTKVYYVFIFLVIPILAWGWAGLVGYIITNMVLGVTLSFVFQLAHVVEGTEFESIGLDTTKHIETAWAVFQLKTTSNFAMHNKFISWCVGGLNFQVEHHLFPKISHIHYPAISKIVQQKCKEFNVPYNYNNSLFGAIASHFKVMKDLGKSPTLANA